MELLKKAAKSRANPQRIKGAKDEHLARLRTCTSVKRDLKEKIQSEGLDGKQMEAAEFEFRLRAYEKRLLVLESIYRDLLSDDFCYHIGNLRLKIT